MGDPLTMHLLDVGWAWRREFNISLIAGGVTNERKPVNDLVISPLNPLILASASDDTTVRIWSLKDEYEKHPCAVICAGEGHRDPIQSIVSISLKLQLIFFLNASYIV